MMGNWVPCIPCRTAGSSRRGMVRTWDFEDSEPGGTSVGSGGCRMMLDWVPMVGRFGVGPGKWAVVGGIMVG